MISRLYAGVAYAAAPWLRLMLRKRVVKGKEIAERLPEREGVAALPRPAGALVWVHAASVGEMMSVLPVIKLLAARCVVLLTTGTVTSAKLAGQRLPPGVIHQFVPLDVPSWVARFLDHWRPDRAVIMESELWPNLLRACDARQIPRFLLNARLSARSARNWRRMPGLARQLLQGFSAITAQSAEDAARFRALGAMRVLAWGNLKFSTPLLPYAPEELSVLQSLLPGPVWLAASTHPGEEEFVLAAHRKLLSAFPDLITILAPRHPERGVEVAALCAFAPRRALGQKPKSGCIYVADTLGELGLFFRLSPFAFIGNSLVAGGGHNIMEPAKLARPVICGPHMENFAEAVELLRREQALIEVSNADELAQAVQAWLIKPDEVKAAGRRAETAFVQAEHLPEQLLNLVFEEVA